LQSYKIYFVYTKNLNNRIFFLTLPYVFFLTDEKSDNDEHDADPFSDGQHLVEKEEHPQGGERRTDIIERVRLGDTDMTQGITEQDERYDAGEDGEVSNA